MNPNIIKSIASNTKDSVSVDARSWNDPVRELFEERITNQLSEVIDQWSQTASVYEDEAVKIQKMMDEYRPLLTEKTSDNLHFDNLEILEF